MFLYLFVCLNQFRALEAGSSSRGRGERGPFYGTALFGERKPTKQDIVYAQHLLCKDIKLNGTHTHKKESVSHFEDVPHICTFHMFTRTDA